MKKMTENEKFDVLKSIYDKIDKNDVLTDIILEINKKVSSDTDTEIFVIIKRNKLHSFRFTNLLFTSDLFYDRWSNGKTFKDETSLLEYINKIIKE